MLRDSKVVLINMPFGGLMSPSIGLGLLKGGLMEAGIQSRTFHFELEFAKLIGAEDYQRIYGRTFPEHLAGEFIFSTALFGPSWATDVDGYVSGIMKRPTKGSQYTLAYSEQFLENLKRIILAAREKTDDFLQECQEKVVDLNPRVVGFTSLFHQHVASLSLAKRIKQQLPNCFIVFGGANCERSMGFETLQQFEFVDAVVSGEGDFVFPELVKKVFEREPIPKVPGVFLRCHGPTPGSQQQLQNTPTIANLDRLPVPNYDDYFEQLARVALSFPIKQTLLFETSRGCWWGEKQHCTFCGLNGDTMVYRSKSEEKAFSEFECLTQKYPVSSISFVDNILNMSYFNRFIPLLAEKKHGLNLFYEVKANLRKDQLAQLRAAGISEIQPGIESLSDNVLRIMRKGVSALQNLQLLKWCKELEIKVHYNLIWGFPGECAEDYLEIARLIPLITHLQPPMGAGEIRIDRFSPNFEQGASRGFKKLLPHPSYSYVYPFSSESLFNLAYFFVDEDNASSKFTKDAKELKAEIKSWRDCNFSSELFWIEKKQHLLIWDFRPTAAKRLTVLTGAEKFCYLSCDRVSTPRQIMDQWARESRDDLLSETDVRSILNSFIQQRLAVKRNDSYLALAYQKRMEAAKSDA